MVSASHVVVIGAGPAGLAMIKSLLEEGFQVSAFEKRDGPGGIWHYTEDPTITSVTSKTKAQLSRFLTPYTDFPHPPGTSRHPTGKELDEYYQQYTDSFGLGEKITYGVNVKSISKDEAASKWLVFIDGEETPRSFDKVVIANGSEHVRRWPAIENIDSFEGRYIHGQEYKDAKQYAGKNVVVIGQGNSAGDCVVELSTHASRVHISHHRGALIIPRMVKGARFDKLVSWKFTRLGHWLERRLPKLHRRMFYHAFKGAHSSAWGKLDPSWNFDNEYRYASNVSSIVLNDDLVPALRNGTVLSVGKISRVVGGQSIEFEDGTRVEDVDCIIACTGYESALRSLCDAIPYSRPAPDIEELPQLYQNIFPINHADSLAILGHSAFMDNAATCRELAGMAIAQIWAGKSSLPSRAEMQRQIDHHSQWYTLQCRDNKGTTQLSGIVEADSWNRFVHEKAGTAVYEKLGWTREGWKFALLHPRLYLQLAYGVGSPHIYRLFETGKRKAWPGALDAIKKANQESKVDVKDSVREWKATKRE